MLYYSLWAWIGQRMFDLFIKFIVEMARETQQTHLAADMYTGTWASGHLTHKDMNRYSRQGVPRLWQYLKRL